jgi:CheY-like chemotaxis protein
MTFEPLRCSESDWSERWDDSRGKLDPAGRDTSSEVAGDSMPSGRTVVPTAATVSPYRVLLVEDFRPERELLGAWLEETSLFVVVGEAGDGPRGVALAGSLRPDLVTLDMSMPGGDGIKALRQILVVSPGSTVAVVSGFVSADMVRATKGLGAKACLDKRIGRDRLVEELVGAVRESRLL